MNRPHQPATTMKPNGGVSSGNGDEAEKESSCEQPQLLEQILDGENLERAWKQVRANKGAPGIDAMTVGQFPDFIRKHWKGIRGKLMDGVYQPSPVKRVLIPKPDGKSHRKIGIPTVLDRVIQQAIVQILTPIYDPTFSPNVYGYRPGRSALDAVHDWLEESRDKGRSSHVVDCDLSKFFDRVNHRKLWNRLRRRIRDPRVLKLIGRFLKAGVILPNGTFEHSPIGMPQGGPLSPLMANILLDEFDKELERRGHRFMRYADDFVILCGSLRAGRRILESITKFLEKRLKLIVNQTKSKVVELSQATFLGFQILKRKLRWTPKSKENFKKKVKNLTGRTRGVSPGKVIEDLKKFARGAFNYYAIGVTYREACELNEWLRRRMRLYYWKQWKRPRTRRRKLLSLGADPAEVHMATRSRKGPWRMSRNRIVQQAMDNQWLHDHQGVPSIRELWIAVRYPSQGAT